MNKHHGELKCKSKVGKGTSFTIILPKGKSHFAEMNINENHPHMSPLVGELLEGMPSDNLNTSKSSNQPSNSENIQSALISTKKVLLIVEDNPEMNHYLVQLFSKNYIVYSAKKWIRRTKTCPKTHA